MRIRPRLSLSLSMAFFGALAGAPAHAFVADPAPVPERSDLRPPAHLLLGNSGLLRGDGARREGLHFLGRLPLPATRALSRGAHPTVARLVTYFQGATGAGDALELQAVDAERGEDGRFTFVQAVRGVPIAGTFALAQVQGGALRYAHAYLVTPPRVAAVPQLSASAAARAALEDARAFAVAASESLQPVQEVVFYVGDAAHLAWQVDLRTEGPDATWQIFVDARSGAVLGRHKTSMTAVSGTVYGNIEPACQGDAPQRVALPHLTWAPGSFTDAEGHFSSDGDVRKARVNMHGRYFKLRTLSLRPKKWEVPLAAVPADNEVVLEDAPLGLVDPYVHAHTARDWARGRLGALSGTAAERTLAWTEAPVQVIVNFGLMRCNAAYMPIMGGLLAFFPGQKGTCNNAGQVAKVVYHEYGHGVHHHLSGMQQFDLQISEGAGDYVASTITNNPDMTGLISCKEPLPTGNKRMQRTCANHYTYCKERGTCDTFAGEEAHTTAPVVCGAFWDLRESLIARYGANEGVRQADTLFLKFLSLSTNLDGIYSAAIAADEDDDGDPKNGTKHSCEINAAFLGEGAGLTAHFPDAKLDRVPCKP